MPQESPAHDEMDPNRQVIDEFRARGGVVGGRFARLPLLLLTTVGARSGQRRTVPVTYVADGERYVVAAGANGANPAWYHNLLAHPAVTVEVGTAVLEAVARAATGAERDGLFDRYASEQPQLVSYQTMADREVPMIVLTPALGYSALRAGLAFIPMAIAIMAAAQASPRLLPRIGLRPLLAGGMLLAAGGFAWLAEIPAHGSYAAHVLGPGLIVALALGLLFTPLATAATTGVPLSQAGLASGVLNTSRQIGGSIGLAALATVAVARSHGSLGTGQSAAGALAAGYDRAFAIAAVLSVIGLACTLFIPTAARAQPDDARQASPSPQHSAGQGPPR